MKQDFFQSGSVLFDLDGTLVDSAKDLINALNVLVTEQNRPPVDFEFARGAVSKGGRAILKRGFPDYTNVAIEEILPHFLDVYAASLAVHTKLYEGMETVLAQFEQAGLTWGIVTNKPGWLARPLLDKLALASRCAALVTGDCLSVKKPNPAPLLHACTLAQISPKNCVYVGDDLRDVQAGKAAGMKTIVAAWGYLDGENPNDWHADFIATQPEDLLTLLNLSRAM